MDESHKATGPDGFPDVAVLPREALILDFCFMEVLRFVRAIFFRGEIRGFTAQIEPVVGPSNR